MSHCVTSVSPHSKPASHFTDGEPEAQRGRAICPRLHCYYRVKPILQCRGSHTAEPHIYEWPTSRQAPSPFMLQDPWGCWGSGDCTCQGSQLADSRFTVCTQLCLSAKSHPYIIRVGGASAGAGGGQRQQQEDSLEDSLLSSAGLVLAVTVCHSAAEIGSCCLDPQSQCLPVSGFQDSGLIDVTARWQ